MVIWSIDCSAESVSIQRHPLSDKEKQRTVNWFVLYSQPYVIYSYVIPVVTLCPIMSSHGFDHSSVSVPLTVVCMLYLWLTVSVCVGTGWSCFQLHSYPQIQQICKYVAQSACNFPVSPSLWSSPTLWFLCHHIKAHWEGDPLEHTRFAMSVEFVACLLHVHSTECLLHDDCIFLAWTEGGSGCICWVLGSVFAVDNNDNENNEIQ